MAACWGKNWGIWHFEQFWTLFSGRECVVRWYPCQGIHFFDMFEVLVNCNFRVSRNCLFCSKMGARVLFNFMRKLLPETSFKNCDIKSNYYLDLHRKFELSSLISSTVIPVLVFEQTHPLKRAWLKVRWPLYKLYGRQNELLKWILWAKYRWKRAEISRAHQSCDFLLDW